MLLASIGPIAASGGVAGGFESIASTSLSTSGTVTFSSIPSTYAALQIRIIGKRTTSNYFNALRLNNDSGANYTAHNIASDGSFVTTTSWQSETSARITSAAFAGAGNSANTFCMQIIDIQDYASTTRHKTMRSLCGFYDTAIGARLDLTDSAWYSTSAVTSIQFDVVTYASGTIISLYGIKAAS